MRAMARARRDKRPFPPSGVVFPWEEEWTRIRMEVALGVPRAHGRDYPPWASLAQDFREGIRDGWLSDWKEAVAPARCYVSYNYSSGWNEGRWMQRDRAMAKAEAEERGEI